MTESDLAIACETRVAAAEEGSQQSKWARHRSLVVEAMKQAEARWKPEANASAERKNPYAAIDGKSLAQGARRKPEPVWSAREEETVPPSVTVQTEKTKDRCAAIESWMSEVVQECNSEQAQFCQKVAEQVLRETRQEAVEPLRWALHGGPGTGKTYALNLVRRSFFEDVLGWKQGSEFQVVTLQAVMANDLDGDTIHQALGLSWQGMGEEKLSAHKFLELSTKALQWRWLIIDEISMVSAELLARLELRCRELVRDLAQSKYGRDSAHARPHGGLNVVLAGDLWQLPPPRGTFLGDVPWEMLTNGKSKKVAQTVRGQELVWGAKEHGVQGVTELRRCERTQDKWLQSLQEQIRDGTLSADNHAFLHGKDTSVPGSWSGSSLECDNPACKKLMDSKCATDRIRSLECASCARERASKARVLVDSAGPATQRKASKAKAIFATNAVKYHVNKLRAQEWAATHGQQVQYAIARDRISSAALQEKPDLGQEKLAWLQRHDQDCGGLYGVLPLCVGMPVTATSHLDRRRRILKGCPGEVVGWTAPEGGDDAGRIWNKLPSCVFVRIHTKKNGACLAWKKTTSSR